MIEYKKNVNFDYYPNVVKLESGIIMCLSQYRETYGPLLEIQPKIINENGEEVLDINSAEVQMQFDCSEEMIPQEKVLDGVYYYAKYYFIEVLEDTESIENLSLGDMNIAFEYDDIEESIALSINDKVLGKVREGQCKDLLIKMFREELDVKPAAILYGINKRDKLIKAKIDLLIYNSDEKYLSKFEYKDNLEAKLTNIKLSERSKPIIPGQTVRPHSIMDEIEEYERKSRKNKNVYYDDEYDAFEDEEYLDDEYEDFDDYDDEYDAFEDEEYLGDECEDFDDYDDEYDAFEDEEYLDNEYENYDDYDREVDEYLESLINKKKDKPLETLKTSILMDKSEKTKESVKKIETKDTKKSNSLFGMDRVFYEEAVEFYGKSYSSRYKKRDLINKYMKDTKKKLL